MNAKKRYYTVLIITTLLIFSGYLLFFDDPSPIETFIFSPYIILLSMTITSIICIIYRKICPTDNKEIKNVSKTKATKNNKNRWIELVIGTIPLIVTLIHGINSAYNGFTFLFNTSYGLDAFFSTIIIDFFIFVPFHIVGMALIIDALISICTKDKKKTSKKK